MITNRSASTYNAAGLSNDTKEAFGITGVSTSKIDAYVIEGEAVNTSLSVIGQGANGNKHILKPSEPEPNLFEQLLENYYFGTQFWSLKMHKIEEVMNSFDNQ